MRSDFPFDNYPSADVKRVVQILHYKGATTTWEALILGTATPYQDLSPYVETSNQDDSSVRLDLRFYKELYGVAQPVIGDLIQVKLDGVPLFNGMVDSLSDYRESRGDRLIAVSVRSRDSTPLWRQTRWAGDIYPTGTELGVIARAILQALGLTNTEIPSNLQVGASTVHGDTQIADMTSWDMLTVLLQAGIKEPWIDAVGRFKMVSRDVSRFHDLEIPTGMLLNIQGGKSQTPVTHVLVKWLDPNLSKSLQQSQVLARESITAGFFRIKQERTLYWSEDRRQRAQNTWMKIIQSVNDGLLPVGDEDYEEKSPFKGQITVTTYFWVPTLATAALAAMLASSIIPDEVIVFGIGASGGITISLGRLIEAIGQVAFFLIIMSLGTGVYEIWGEPYDFVHETNTTEAYNDSVPGWVRLEETISTDFMMNQGHSEALAIAELMYKVFSANSWNIDIVDHPLIERGDILKLPDGSRLYVSGYSRDLTRDAPAILSVKGFRV